jgi:(2Fe-2S) ferredoxin
MSYYQHHVFFCTNQREPEANGETRPCCASHQANEVRDYAKKRIKQLNLNGEGKVRINNAGCLDRCELGPCLVVYPEGIWYTYVDKSDVDEIIDSHLNKGVPVTRLMIADSASKEF